MLSVHTLRQEAQIPAPVKRRMGRKEERQALEEALERLPEVPRLVLALRYCEGLRPRQIAAVLGLEEETVRGLLVDASAEVLRSLDTELTLPQPRAVRSKEQSGRR
jgi:RNA polymerase sigma factor (sigma-70 family)